MNRLPLIEIIKSHLEWKLHITVLRVNARELTMGGCSGEYI